MKTTIIKTVIALIGAGATTAYAASNNIAGEGSGPLVWFLIGFGAVVILLQAVPALVMFASMIKGLFSPADKSATVHKG
jgi:hypothetical protein